MYAIFWNVHAGMDSFTKNSASRLHGLSVGFYICQNCHILIGVYPTNNNHVPFCFRRLRITSHALQQSERKRNTTSSSMPTGGCMFVAMTSGDVGRCTVQPELVSSKVSRCVPDKEAGDEERSTKDATTTV